MKIGSHNTATQNTHNQLDKNKTEEKKLLERIAAERALSGEDSANLLIGDALRNNISTLTQGVKNANDAIGMLQIADGTLSSLSDSTGRLTELSVQMGNAALNADQRAMLESEAAALSQAMGNAVSSATYQGVSVFRGEMTFSTGEGEVALNLQAPSTSGVNIADMESIRQLSEAISRGRSDIGSATNELSSLTNAHLTAITELVEAESKLQNNDVAENFNELNTALLKENAGLYAQAFNTGYLQKKVDSLLA